MAIDVETNGSPGWWLNTLAKALHDRRAGRQGNNRYTRGGVDSSRIRPGLVLLDDYLRGDPPLRDDIHSGWAAPFRQFLRMGRMNVAPMLVSAPASRMGIRDFRTAAADDELGDREARLLIRRNNLRLAVREVHDHMLGLGDGYTIVTPPDDTRSWSLITAESPLHCITVEDAMTGATIAGLKMFRDDWDACDWAYLFLPGEIWVARAQVQASTLFRRTFRMSDQWQWVEDLFDDVPNNRVAITRFRNKDGRSEIEGHLNDLDRINDKLFNEWWIGKIQAFRQRALEQPDEQVDPKTGVSSQAEEDEQSAEEIAAILTSSPDALWTLPKGAKIWESTPVDLRMLVDSIKAELQWLASTSFNPLHSITPDASQGSAEGASLQREEHVYKIEDRRDRAGGSWAKTLAMAFEFQGDNERAAVELIDPIYGPIERYSLQEKSNAASQLKGTLPAEVIQTDVLQYETADVQERIRPLRDRELLLNDQAAAAAAASAAGASAAKLPPAPTADTTP